MKFSEINTVVIKSGHKISSPPRIGQRLRIEGDSQTYVVLRSDINARVADLVCTTGKHSMKRDVPFDSLRVPGTGLAEVLGHFLKSA